MIQLHRLNGRGIVLNAELIQTVEAIPKCIVGPQGQSMIVVEKATFLALCRVAEAAQDALR